MFNKIIACEMLQYVHQDWKEWMISWSYLQENPSFIVNFDSLGFCIAYFVSKT